MLHEFVGANREEIIRRCNAKVTGRLALPSTVTEYGREREPSVGRAAAGENEHIRVLARELRTSIQTAIVALEVIKSGSVGIAGSTGTVLDRNLVGAHALVDRLLAEVYLAPAPKTGPVM